MRIISVTARAFGGITNDTLEPAPGLTVVYGPNEAGKSTWHSAVYAAICGIRRGPGMRKADRSFKEQYLPWSGEPWVVECVLNHTDGRRIRIHRDLEGKVDDRAEDVISGRDVSNEIIRDGSPDASTWLGLDRNCFLATACVRQAEVVAVANDAELLQEFIERGVATAGVDATAARALQCISDYRRDNVGLDRAGSRKPLRAALNALSSARTHLSESQGAHAEYLELDLAARDLEKAAVEARSRLTDVETLLRRRTASDLRARVDRAREISDLFMDGPPADRVDDDDRAARVTEAITRWKTLPDLHVLAGDTSAELEARLASLPESPIGDLAVDPEVRDSRDAFLTAANALQALEAKEPQRLADAPPHGLSGADIRELARALSTSEFLTTDTAHEGTANKSGAGAVVAIIGGLAMLVGLLVAGLASTAVGLAVVAVGLVALLTGIVLRHRQPVGRPNVEEIAAAVRAHEYASRRQQAIDTVHEAGLPTDPSVLASMADDVDALADAERRYGSWLTEREELRLALGYRGAEFREVLSHHGQLTGDDVLDSYAAYERSCAERADLARRAAGREDLEARLEQTREAEDRSRHAAAERRTAEQLLDAVASECGIETSDADQIVAELEVWLADRRDSIVEHEGQVKLWAELEATLGGSDLDSLETELRDIESQLNTGDRLIEERPDAATRDLEREADSLRTELDTLRSNADRATGRSRERSTQIPSVAAAEEDVANAEAELTRVQRLDHLLATTTEFLRHAEEKAHRNIAPKLKTYLEEWLPVITEGRHTEVAVDVDTLEVRVKQDGMLRPATSLSHGTTEQLYLLLRMALVEHLVGGNGPCPLLIDDVTVQSDGARTVKIMEMLLTMSEEKQIIVFSQEEEVRRWAEETLQPPSHLLLDLTG